MAERRILTCDKCSRDGADRYLIGRTGQTLMQIDLCPGCAHPVEDMLTLGVKYDRSKRAPYRKFEKVKVTPA